MPVQAARVGYLQASTAWNNINHINRITAGNGQDPRNSTQINQSIGNHQTNLIYSVRHNTTTLKNELDTILQRVFLAQNVVTQAQRAQQPIQPQTTYQSINSGINVIPLQELPNTENDSIKNAYSNTPSLNSPQGIFMIESAIDLYHTEPKGLDKMLKELAYNNQGQISDVVLISQRPMCACCTRLILNVINNRRNTNGFPNVIVISGAQFQLWLQQLQGQNALQNIPQPIRNILTQQPQQGQGNKLALFIHYQ